VLITQLVNAMHFNFQLGHIMQSTFLVLKGPISGTQHSEPNTETVTVRILYI